MEERKVVRFKLDNGQWRSKVYYPTSEKDENEDKPPKLSAKRKSAWPPYDTDIYANYVDYVMGIEKEKEDEKPIDNKTLFNRDINVSWGQLQPELTAEAHKFSAKAHKYTKQQLIDSLNNENATRNIERLSKMDREDVESEYKFINKFALSNRDNTEQRVNDAFLKGKGLEDITIKDKKYKGLLFDENSEQSKRLGKANSFKRYYNNYLSCMKDIIRESVILKEIDTDAISEKLSTRLKKPNFSDYREIKNYDYYGLMGGTQNIDIDFKITPKSNGEYNLKTTMHLNDWYGADADDINKKIDYKNIATSTLHAMSNPLDFTNVVNYKIIESNIKSNYKSLIPGLNSFFWLQHHFGCEPFLTRIIYKSEDTIKLVN